MGYKDQEKQLKFVRAYYKRLRKKFKHKRKKHNGREIENVLDIPLWWHDPVKRCPRTRAEIQFDKKNRVEVRARLVFGGYLVDNPNYKF